MRIVAYLHHLDQAGRLTGVGRHMTNMTQGLAHFPRDGTGPGAGVELRTLTYKKFLIDGQYPSDTPYAGMPAVGLPLSPAWMHRAWVLLGMPIVDRWCPGADWVYCPLEIYVPTRARLAVTVHDLHAFETDLPWSNTPQHQRFQAKWKVKFRPLLKQVTLFAAVSEFTRKRMIRFLGIPDEKIAVVGNGVEEEFYAVAERPVEEFRRPEGPYVIVIGGLTPRKGGSALLNVARALQKSDKDLRVLVAGGNDPELEEQSKSVPNVTRLGYVSDAQLPGLVRGAVALLHLARYEGFGIPAVEAMAAGTPAIVSNFAALPTVAGNAGIVVDVDQPDAIADMVMNLARDSALRRRYEELGRARAREFHWRACVERLVTAMKER